MFIKGFLMMAFFPIGRSKFSDKMHYLLALMYFFDHIGMAELLNMKSVYKFGFIISLILVIYFGKSVRDLFRQMK